MPQLEISTFIPQVFWLIVTFSTLYIIMWKIAVPCIADVLEGRQKRIEDNLNKATKAKQEAEKTLSTYENLIKETRAEAQKLHLISAKKTSDTIELSEEKLSDELNIQIAASEEEIQNAINGAMENIQLSAIEIASEAISRLTEQSPDDKELKNASKRVLNT
jgi:F-type H+-transporting ATPase subunit b